MTYADWEYRPRTGQWVNLQTGITIADEDMPWELKPEQGIRKCKHCHVEIDQHAPDSPYWAHITQGGGRLNRCQHDDVEYGHEAHPEGTDCPEWCLGSRR